MALAQYFVVTKFLRRLTSKFVAGTLGLHDVVKIWPMASAVWRRWLVQLAANPWTKHPAFEIPHTMVLVTDASTSGYGGVLFDESTGEFYETAGVWDSVVDPAQMPQKETDAVTLALRRFKKTLTNCASLLLLIDSTTAAHALRRGTSKSEALAESVKSALEELPANCEVKVAYIPTHENPADPLSRGRSSDSKELASLGQKGRWLVRSSMPLMITN
jgi:hypothetical protein